MSVKKSILTKEQKETLILQVADKQSELDDMRIVYEQKCDELVTLSREVSNNVNAGTYLVKDYEVEVLRNGTAIYNTVEYSEL